MIVKSAAHSNSGNRRGMKESKIGTIEKKFGSKEGLKVPL